MIRTSPFLSYIYVGLASSGVALALGLGLRVARASDHKGAPSSVQETLSLLCAPQTAAQWLKVFGYAQSLMAGAKRLQEPALPVGANAHSRLTDTSGTRTAARIRADIDADPVRFRGAAIRLGKASDQALAAVRAPHVAGLSNAGEVLDVACEACRAAYWHPRTQPSLCLLRWNLRQRPVGPDFISDNQKQQTRSIVAGERLMG